MEFSVIRVLGEGMFSKTELAKTPEGKQIVVKTFPVQSSDNWKDLELFQREEQVLKQLNHAALPQFYGVNRDNETYQLGYHYIEGKNLIEMMEGQLYIKNELDAVRFLKRMGDILHYLHCFNPPIIHRDIKPANIIVDDRGQIHLIDFGATISTLADRGGSTTVIGTSGYMPPEQLQGQALPASDLYALGATVIYLITGVPPEDLLDEQFRFRFREHMQIELSSLFCSLLDQLTDPYLEARFQSA